MNGDRFQPTDVEVRAPIAVVSAGPHAAEVTSRIDALEEEGQPVVLVCLDTRAHEHEPTRADVLHVPLLSAGIISSLLARSGREPKRVFATAARLVGGLATPRLAAATIVRLPSAIYLSQLLARRGVTEVRGLDQVASKIASVIAQLCDLTPPDLSELPVDWSRLNARRVGVRWYSRRINSIAAEVSLDGGQRMIVKRQRTHAGGSAADRWARESGVLRELGEAMGEGMLSVPRVLLSDRAASLVVMERARGAALDSLFAPAAADEASLARLVSGIRGAGAWLKAMQRVTRRSGDGRALLADAISAAIEDAAKLSRADRVIRRHHDTIVRRLNELQECVSASELTVAGHHDDYWPGNIFFDGERVTVIDFESFRDGLPLEDAAYFLIRSNMLRRRFRVPLPELASAFFDGYSPGEKPDVAALQLFTVTKGLRDLARGAGEDLALPQRLWTRRTIRNAVLSSLQPSL